ncbi:DNA polymerase [Thermoanaerobacter sp. YS13]|uniref:group II intron reverse transcriptase/maturase n=1 Tax=Thermoanaerobacter sp. YS13 TaxID=1511746 RepID=UPI0005748373|nr:group II intron reverse transcriptase/maturase [Thermoanaerobacter sp. YS13]KHO61816.1 DNA polymerase [Thermoanaerobacter sp. YS13]KHO63078.1 DNA polymerase [Thermoanaerobacter sp. YS13]KHO63081.1 DNA polymerase [Thermoanaerobacter sp. YS13]
METELTRIAEVVAKHPRDKLQTLVHFINEETLKQQHKKMTGNKAPGIDKITKEEYGENLTENIENLMARMKRQAYKPQPVRRVYIPKEGSDKLRPLGIPAYEDKLVQGIMADILNIIYEPEFLDISYGFRPNKSGHDALRQLNNIIQEKKVSYIVDADIKGFFDNVDHEWMMKFLEHRIGDKNFLRIIKRFLIAGVMEEGKYYESDIGTPQGGHISPILANIYLHYVLDLWFEKRIKKACRGESYEIRYADDFVCCFQYKDDAEKFYKSLKKRLKEFELELAEEKTRIIEFGRFAEESRKRRGLGKPETFTFLGFTHYCSKSQNGKFRVKRKTSKKKFINKVAKMKKWLKENMHEPVNQLIKRLNIKLLGHYRYYGITDNSKSIGSFFYLTRRQLFKTLKRRSQKHRLNWDKYEKLLMKFPLATPKIYVSIYS